MIAVFATGTYFEFGNENKLPWGSCREDLQRFKQLTANKVLLMGAQTFRSLPSLLPNRVHVVLSNDSQVRCKNGDRPHYVYSGDFKRVIEEVKATVGNDIAVIGGPSIIVQAVQYGEIDFMHITTIGVQKEMEHDVQFDYRPLLHKFKLTDKIVTKYAKVHIQECPITITERIYAPIS
ncbi:dihydrofolate reductase [Cronobacter phage S13]|jgi:dihydrofolate reductase|uniref:dihydrofolate reductase n=1 Tax=Cronobacter phage LPCS28 TaxID=2924885 RepID=A0AAE9GBL4_9CAUD|nr:dihydrofolate reductase [Cronobacter phage S13]YP_010665867.1 dihydrofolate reductase [Cronobacter phage LPCS28]AIA64815.1 putative dihydrofolate reductase [Cronobacter phage S13]UNY47056.1 hypothetical protein EHEKIMEA_00174 [Cronobacter phage LPCS28]